MSKKYISIFEMILTFILVQACRLSASFKLLVREREEGGRERESKREREREGERETHTEKH
jgi:hypothetical protein